MPTIAAIDVVILIAAVGYLVYAVVETDGPLNIFDLLRKAPLTIGKLASCPICASFWVALLVVYLYGVLPIVVYALALAGVLLILREAWDLSIAPAREAKTREQLKTAVQISKQFDELMAHQYLFVVSDDVSDAMERVKAFDNAE